MSVVWRIDVRLGEGDDAALIRSERIEARCEEAALRELADRIESEPDSTVLDGQEELSVRGEFAPGSNMPPLEMRAETDDAAATDARPPG